MPSQDTKPSFPAVLASAVERALARARVCLPGKVISYDAALQAVDVQPVIRDLFEDEEGAAQYETLPVIPRVPVVFLGGGGFRVTVPIRAGDHVTLIFADRSIDSWLAQGGILNPTPGRAHDLADAIAIPGLRSFKSPLASAPTDTMSIGADDGPTIEISNTEIQAGGTAALATLADLQALRTWIVAQSYNGTGSTPGSALSVPSPTGTTVLKGS